MAEKRNARTAAENADWAEGKVAASWADFGERFGTEERCEEYLISLKSPEGFACPRCGHGEYAKVGGGRREYRCTGCNRQFSATVGTVLEGTKLPLTKWFRAIRMVAADTRGASAQAVARECGVSDATGASMPGRLRTSMGFSMSLCKVGGDWVEVDAAHISCGNPGEEVSRPGRGKTDAPVMVAVSDSRCVIRAASDSTKGTAEAFAAAHGPLGEDDVFH
jgi:transposase-like protein